MNTQEIFAQRLKKHRLMAGLSLIELSNLSGVDNSLIGRYEKAQREPTLSNLIRLAKTLGVSLDYLVGLTDQPNTHGRIPVLPTATQELSQIIESLTDENRQWAFDVLRAILKGPNK